MRSRLDRHWITLLHLVYMLKFCIEMALIESIADFCEGEMTLLHFVLQEVIHNINIDSICVQFPLSALIQL